MSLCEYTESEDITLLQLSVHESMHVFVGGEWREQRHSTER